LSTKALAQFTNPGFEGNAQGWSATCGLTLTGDVPANGGSVSASLPMLSINQPACYWIDGIQPFVYQSIPGLQNGDQVTVSYWTKAVPDFAGNASAMTSLIIYGWMTSATAFNYDLSNTSAYDCCVQVPGTWTLRQSTCTISGLPGGATVAILLGGQAFNGANGTIFFDNVTMTSSRIGAVIRANAKLFLDGAYDQASSRMRDDLRASGLLPTAEPYTALGLPNVIATPGEAAAPSVLATTGDNAVVDWVHIELRDCQAPGTIVVSKNGLLQRDGDVVNADGTTLSFPVGQGNYLLAVRHRNHLGVMTAQPLELRSTAVVVDLRNTALSLYTRPNPYTDQPGRVLGSVRTLWAGNLVADAPVNAVKYVGSGNDRDPILVAVGSTTPNNVTSGYRAEDVNLDGVVKYTGAGNDRDAQLISVGSTSPTTTRWEQLP
jgi:hypothetical protein